MGMSISLSNIRTVACSTRIFIQNERMKTHWHNIFKLEHIFQSTTRFEDNSELAFTMCVDQST